MVLNIRLELNPQIERLQLYLPKRVYFVFANTFYKNTLLVKLNFRIKLKFILILY